MSTQFIPCRPTDVTSAEPDRICLAQDLLASAGVAPLANTDRFSRFDDVPAAPARLQPSPVPARATTSLKAGECAANDEELQDALAWIRPRSDARAWPDDRLRLARFVAHEAVRKGQWRRQRVEKLAPGEAHAGLARLGQRVCAGRGHRFAAGIRSADGLRLLGVAICSRPWPALADGLTIVLQGAAVEESFEQEWRRLLAGIERLAANQGYRRIVANSADASLLLHLRRAGWDPIGRTDRGIWGKTLRALSR